MCSGGFRGGSGSSLEPPSGTKLFQFHGEIYEKSGKILKTNPLLMDLNPPSRNPGSTPDVPEFSIKSGQSCESSSSKLQLLGPGCFGLDSCDVTPRTNTHNGSGISVVKLLPLELEETQIVVKNIFL